MSLSSPIARHASGDPITDEILDADAPSKVDAIVHRAADRSVFPFPRLLTAIDTEIAVAEIAIYYGYRILHGETTVVKTIAIQAVSVSLYFTELVLKLKPVGFQHLSPP